MRSSSVLSSGFFSKLLFAQAAVESMHKMLPTLIALAISTILNAMYFMRTVILIYTPDRRSGVRKKKLRRITIQEQPSKTAALILFIILNLFLGLSSEPVIALFRSGLGMFA